MKKYASVDIVLDGITKDEKKEEEKDDDKKS